MMTHSMLRPSTSLQVVMLLSSILLAWLFIVFVVNPARKAARREAVRHNSLYQHSGWHPNCAVISSKGEVVSVFSCPTCSSVSSDLNYFDENRNLIEAGDLSAETVQQAKAKLAEYQEQPQFKTRFERFKQIDSSTGDTP